MLKRVDGWVRAAAERETARTGSVQSDTAAAAAAPGASPWSCVVRGVTARRRLLCGACLALAGAVCWAATLVCLRRSLRRGADASGLFYAPFFVTYLSSSFAILVFPVYVVFRLVVARAKLPLRDITRYT